MNKKIAYVLIFGLIAMFAGVFFTNYARKKQRQLMSPKLGDIKESIYGLGVVESSEVFEYKLALTSTLKKVHVREGDQVKKGQLLLQFHESPSLYAPFAGVVTYLPFHEDENIFAQVPVLRLENLSNRYLEVTLEQQGALRVKPKQKARLSFESLRGSLFFGEVESIYPTGGQFMVRIQPKDLPPEILPGMTADAAIEVAEKKQVTLIPVDSVMNGVVSLQRDGRNEKIPVKLGTSDGTWSEVLDGSVRMSDQLFVPSKQK